MRVALLRAGFAFHFVALLQSLACSLKVRDVRPLTKGFSDHRVLPKEHSAAFGDALLCFAGTMQAVRPALGAIESRECDAEKSKENNDDG